MYEDLIGGLDYLHTQKYYIHSDVKPMNIGITPTGHFQLIDYGSLTAIGVGRYTSHTLPFVPSDYPGFTFGPASRYGAAPLATSLADLWSLAITLGSIMPVPPPLGQTSAVVWVELGDGRSLAEVKRRVGSECSPAARDCSTFATQSISAGPRSFVLSVFS